MEIHYDRIKVFENQIVNEEFITSKLKQLQNKQIKSIYFKIDEGPDLNKLKFKNLGFIDWLRSHNVDHNKISIEADNLLQDKNIWPKFIKWYNEEPFLYGQRINFENKSQVNKQFGMFIGGSRWPRLYFASHMHRHYKESCLMSFNQKNVNASLVYENTGNDDAIKEMVDSFKKIIPINLDLIKNDYINYDEAYNLCDYYNNINIDIVFETWWEGSTFMPTEKTARPLLTKTPFVLFGPKHYLKNLRKLGFQTFDPHIDESYDYYEGYERLVKMTEVVYNIQKVKKQRLDNILQHNKEVYMNLTKQKFKEEFGCL